MWLHCCQFIDVNWRNLSNGSKSNTRVICGDIILYNFYFKYSLHKLFILLLHLDPFSSTTNFIQYNNVPQGFSVYKDKVFVAIPRRRIGVPSTMNYVKLNGSDLYLNPKLHSYPNYDMNELDVSICGGVCGIETKQKRPWRCRPKKLYLFPFFNDLFLFNYLVLFYFYTQNISGGLSLILLYL